MPIPSLVEFIERGVDTRPIADGKFTRTAFGYFGAKLKICMKIAAILPPHNAWVDVFCGSAAVTLTKSPAPIEVINDLDDEIVNFFKQLRERPVELCAAIELTPYARTEYTESKTINPRDAGLERARRFLAASMMTVNGAAGSNHAETNHSGFSYALSYSRMFQEARVSRWNNVPDRVWHVAERLKTVRVENLDARALMKMFLHRPATLLYLDPPYLMERDHGYRKDANDEDFHKELLELCLKAKCMILVSGYKNPLYDAYLSRKNGWKRSSIVTHTKDTTGRDFARTEYLWTNKHFEKARRQNKIPIRLSQFERKQNKINPLR